MRRCNGGALVVLLLLLVLSYLSGDVVALVVPDTDFYLDVNGISISVETDFFCVLEMKLGEEMGGKIGCYGDDDESGRLDPPEDDLFVQVVTGQSYGCGVSLDQTVTCWGRLPSPKGLFTQLTGEAFFACGIMVDASIQCWGNVPHIDHMPVPSTVDGQKTTYVQVSCGSSHCCALDDQAVPHCWGQEADVCPFLYPPTLAVPADLAKEDEDEEDEDDAYADDEELNAAKAGRVKVQMRQVSAASGWSCGITLEGQDMHCWGHRRHHLQNPGRYPPKFAQGPFKQVATGELGVCALHGSRDHGSETPHRLQCWGDAIGIEEQLRTREFDQVTVSKLYACAIDMNSEVHCWGKAPVSVLRIPTELVVA